MESDIFLKSGEKNGNTKGLFIYLFSGEKNGNTKGLWNLDRGVVMVAANSALIYMEVYED